MAQERRVLLANGQYITIVQTTGNSTGDVMSQSAVTAALSTKSDVGHTHNASAITGGTFGTSRIADKSITLEKLADNVPLPTTLYETVRVSGLTTGGVAAVGADVTIGGDFYRFDSTGVVSAQIPYGQAYKIQAYPNSTWLGGYDAAFTANAQSRSISITYFESNGVFIEATDGTLYTSSDWNSGKTANSIVVVSHDISFRIALTQTSSSIQMLNYNNKGLEDYLAGADSKIGARLDYNGITNTKFLLQQLNYNGYAAAWCDAFTFPDGKTKGFIPACGQLYLAFNNKNTINTALSKCGGTAMDSYKYWTSTFGGSTNYGNFFWVILSNGSVSSSLLDDYCYVRPFAAYP